MSFVHDDPEFVALLSQVSAQTGIAAALVEKDCWVTHSLTRGSHRCSGGHGSRTTKLAHSMRHGVRRPFRESSRRDRSRPLFRGGWLHPLLADPSDRPARSLELAPSGPCPTVLPRRPFRESSRWSPAVGTALGRLF